MKAEIDTQWMTAQDFARTNPLNAGIVAVEVKDNKGKPDKQLIIALEGQLDNFRRLSIWGSNWNGLIKAYGTETDAWKGKRIQLLRETYPEGQNRTTIRPI